MENEELKDTFETLETETNDEKEIVESAVSDQAIEAIVSTVGSGNLIDDTTEKTVDSEMEEAKWYVLHTFSGYENVAKENLEIVKDKYNFKDIENLVGTPLIEDTEHTTTDVKVEIPGEKINKCYIWTQEDLNDQGLASISSNKSEFYIVCYGDDEIEVYYSKAVDGKYSLTELQEED